MPLFNYYCKLENKDSKFDFHFVQTKRKSYRPLFEDNSYYDNYYESHNDCRRRKPWVIKIFEGVVHEVLHEVKGFIGPLSCEKINLTEYLEGVYERKK